jgi:hypothetical protein
VEFALGIVKKVGKKWYIYSHDGERLEGPFSTKKEAKKRLREIEYFKSQGMKKKENYIEYKVQAEIIDPADLSDEFFIKAGIKKNSDLLYTSYKMCHANTNDNKDAFEDAELSKNFDTAKFKPINIEHDDDEIVGTIYDADYIKEPTKEDDDFPYIMSYGVIYKKKFPEVAAEVIKRHAEGNLFYSMEAWFDTAVCSECEGEFTVSADYCEHLNSRFESTAGVSRILRGVTFGGCGIVEHPADKGATNLSMARKNDTEKEDTRSFIDTQDEDVLLEKSLIDLVKQEEADEQKNRAFWAFSDIVGTLLRDEEVTKEVKLDRFIELSEELLTMFGIIENNSGGKLLMSKRVFESDAEFEAEVSKITKPLEDKIADVEEKLEKSNTDLEAMTQEKDDLASLKEEAEEKLSDYIDDAEAEKALQAKIDALIEDGLDKDKIDEDLKSTLAELSDEGFEVLRKTFSFEKKADAANDTDGDGDGSANATINPSTSDSDDDSTAIGKAKPVIRGFLKELPK